jgi:hypothetical protein
MKSALHLGHATVSGFAARDILIVGAMTDFLVTTPCLIALEFW